MENRPSTSPAHHEALLVLALAVLAAALGLAGTVGLERGRQEWGLIGALWLATALWLGIAEVVLLAVLRKWARPLARHTGRWTWPVLIALLSAPAWFCLGSKLFSGQRIARSAIAPVGPMLVTALASGGTGLAVLAFQRLLVTERNWRRGIAWGLVVLAATLPLLVARTVPSPYAYLWDTSLLLTWLLLQGATYLALPAGPLARYPRMVGAILLVAFVASTTVVAIWQPKGRSLLQGAFQPSDRIVAAWQWLIDMDGDAASPILGGGDCDDLDEDVGPLGREIADDGLDQDCDGADLTRATEQAREAFWRQRFIAGLPHGPGVERLRAACARAAIVLISVDALRADHLFGHPRATELPAIRRLLDTGARFERAYAPASSTRLSLPVLHTSRFSPSMRPPAPTPTLALYLRAAGYRTAMTGLAHPIDFIRADRLELHPPFDLRLGFDRVDLLEARNPGPAMRGLGTASAEDANIADHTLALVRELSTDPRPFFLWVHFFDLHQWAFTSPRRAGESAAGHYDRAAAATLVQVARFLDGLTDLVGSRPVVVALVADHGEALGEFGFEFHTRFLYDFLVHVPVVIRAPELAPRVIREPITLADLMPTLLSLVGLETCAGCAGEDLGPLLTAEHAPTLRGVLLRENDQVALIRQGWKLLFAPRPGEVELYPLGRERPEWEASSSRPEIARDMLGLLRASPLRTLPPLGGRLRRPSAGSSPPEALHGE